jgi:hypothetical protein
MRDGLIGWISVRDLFLNGSRMQNCLMAHLVSHFGLRNKVLCARAMRKERESKTDNAMELNEPEVACMVQSGALYFIREWMIGKLASRHGSYRVHVGESQDCTTLETLPCRAAGSSFAYRSLDQVFLVGNSAVSLDREIKKDRTSLVCCAFRTEQALTYFSCHSLSYNEVHE